MIRRPGDPEFIHKLRALIREEVETYFAEALAGTIDDARSIVSERLADKLPSLYGGAAESSRSGEERPMRHEPRQGRPPARNDPRLPPPGTELTKEYAGRTLRITVRDDGFEYGDKVYPSLSAVAAEVTGSRPSGFQFFAQALAEANRKTR